MKSIRNMHTLELISHLNHIYFGYFRFLKRQIADIRREKKVSFFSNHSKSYWFSLVIFFPSSIQSSLNWISYKDSLLEDVSAQLTSLTLYITKRPLTVLKLDGLLQAYGFRTFQMIHRQRTNERTNQGTDKIQSAKTMINFQPENTHTLTHQSLNWIPNTTVLIVNLGKSFGKIWMIWKPRWFMKKLIAGWRIVCAKTCRWNLSNTRSILALFFQEKWNFNFNFFSSVATANFKSAKLQSRGPFFQWIQHGSMMN